MPELKYLTFTVCIPAEAVDLGPEFLAAFIRSQADDGINSALNCNEFWGLFQKGDKT